MEIYIHIHTYIHIHIYIHIYIFRVDTVRPYAVESMLSMLLTDSLILGQARQTVSEVLKAAAWIVGEYSGIVSLIANDRGDVSETPGEDEGYWIEGIIMYKIKL
jgi:hypothetical protein